MLFSCDAYQNLDKADVIKTLLFINSCQKIDHEEDFHKLILDFAAFIGFEYVMYGYTKSSYSESQKVNVVNISYPESWFTEYTKFGYIDNDPLREEISRRIATDSENPFIPWDDCQTTSTLEGHHIFERCKTHGLVNGCSIYDNSKEKDYAFLISFASASTTIDLRTEQLSRFIISHLMMCRKRLDILMLVNTLTEKEKMVAIWIKDCKTNWEIAQILEISTNTVKFHTKNIFSKIGVSSRQQLVSVLIAVEYMSS